MINKVIHLIPKDCIGGVEIAAKSIKDGQHGKILFKKIYILNKDSRFSINNPLVGQKYMFFSLNAFVKNETGKPFFSLQ